MKKRINDFFENDKNINRLLIVNVICIVVFVLLAYSGNNSFVSSISKATYIIGLVAFLVNYWLFETMFLSKKEITLIIIVQLLLVALNCLLYGGVIISMLKLSDTFYFGLLTAFVCRVASTIQKSVVKQIKESEKD